MSTEVIASQYSLTPQSAAKLVEQKAAKATAQTRTRAVGSDDKKDRLRRLPFIPLETDRLEALALKNKTVWLLILVRLEELWWVGMKRNPVKLSAFTSGGIHVFGDKKARGLAILEEAGLVFVEPRFKKSPLVTLAWRPDSKSAKAKAP
jgi:hypothetical protein